jgi:magnesium transporter
MLRFLSRSVPGLQAVTDIKAFSLPEDAIWVDLSEPTREEELAVEAALRLELPTREEMAEIEPSSRLYQEHGATVMIASLLYNSEGDAPQMTPVTFALIGERVVTIRYAEPRAFTVYATQTERVVEDHVDGAKIFIGLLDAVVDRLADILERTSGEVERASRDIFRRPRVAPFEDIIDRLGRAQTTDSMARDSLVSISRVLSFSSLAEQIEGDTECREHIKSLHRDAQSLTDHASYQSGNITFLLDAAMGLINIEQNDILKRFTVLTIMLMPPTLVAGIYGMNFHNLPELSWSFGYFAALALMVIVAFAPLIYFRVKRWL